MKKELWEKDRVFFNQCSMIRFTALTPELVSGNFLNISRVSAEYPTSFRETQVAVLGWSLKGYFPEDFRFV